jgi:hypothetical protein
MVNNIWNDYVFSYFRENPIATGIQIVTTIPYSIAFWREKKENVQIWVAISSALFAIGYFLLSAWSGIIIAVGTSISAMIGKRFSEKKEVTLKTRLIVFTLIVVGTVITSLFIERILIMWLILFAGFLGYYAYIIFREYGKAMHMVLILSQIIFVIYEIIFLLYLFALLDFITMLVITVHLIKKITLETKQGYNIAQGEKNG